MRSSGRQWCCKTAITLAASTTWSRTPAGQWLKVVVDYEWDPRSGRERGSVLTAFLHRRLRTGDTALYIRNKD